MKDEGRKRKVERRRGYKRQSRILLIFVFSLVACSSQQPVSSTICRDGFHVLDGLDNMIEYSPNEQWILTNCASTTEDSHYVRVFRVDGTASWTIPFEDFPWNNSEDPLRSLVSYYWTKAGKHVYLHPTVCCFTSTYHGVFVTDYSLYLLDLQTGELSVVVSGENNDLTPFSVSISPDEKYFVYVDLGSTPNVLNISNLQTGETRLVELDSRYVDTGVFVWTPDNSKLIFVAVFDGWTNSSLYSLEMNSFALKTIIYDDQRLLFPTSKWDYQGSWGNWKDEDTLFLSEFVNPNDWVVNIQTGVLVEDNSWDAPP